MRIRMNTTRWVVVTLVLATGAAIAYGMRPKPLIVDTARVARRDLEATIDADGRTRVRERYVVVAPVAGRVQRITHVEGAPVRAGDVVARIAPLPLDSLAVAQAQARIDAAVARSLDASAQARVADAALNQRRRELSRASRLAEVGGMAPREVEEAQLAVTQADEAARSAREQVRATDADVRQARAVLVGQGNGAATIIFVRAPAGGRVLRVPERSERIVAAGAPLIEIGDPGSLEIVIDVLSSDGASVHPGDRVRLAGWAAEIRGEADSVGWGRVREIEPAGFTKVSALGVDEQRVNVIVDPVGLPRAVGDAFRVDASIIVWSAPRVVVVPRSALLQNGGVGEWTAFVVRSGRVERRHVRLGHVAGAAAEVISGVGVGDEVVLFPSDRVTPGVRVSSRGS